MHSPMTPDWIVRRAAIILASNPHLIPGFMHRIGLDARPVLTVMWTGQNGERYAWVGPIDQWSAELDRLKAEDAEPLEGDIWYWSLSRLGRVLHVEKPKDPWKDLPGSGRYGKFDPDELLPRAMDVVRAWGWS